jgi:tetratricopeptide (TPR) repeat protein
LQITFAARILVASSLVLVLARSCPAGQPTSTPESYDSCLARGMAYLDKSNWEPALAAAHQLIKIDPNRGDAYCILAFDATNRDDHESAIELGLKGLKLPMTPRCAVTTRSVVASALSCMGEHQRARDVLIEELKFVPNDFGSASDLAEEYDSLRQYELAIQSANRAIAGNKDYKKAYVARGYAYYRLGKLDRALDDITQYVSLDPSDRLAYETRANLYAMRARYQQAVDDYTKAIAMTPFEEESLYKSRGESYSKLGQWDKAVEDFNQAIKLEPDYVEAYKLRALAYEKLGKPELAKQDEKILSQLR